LASASGSGSWPAARSARSLARRRAAAARSSGGRPAWGKRRSWQCSSGRPSGFGPQAWLREAAGQSCGGFLREGVRLGAQGPVGRGAGGLRAHRRRAELKHNEPGFGHRRRGHRRGAEERSVDGTHRRTRGNAGSPPAEDQPRAVREDGRTGRGSRIAIRGSTPTVKVRVMGAYTRTNQVRSQAKRSMADL